MSESGTGCSQSMLGWKIRTKPENSGSHSCTRTESRIFYFL